MSSDNSDESEITFDELADDADGVEMPNFVVPNTLDEDDEEIAYYARKLGIDDEIDEWDSEMRDGGYAKILEGITSGRRTIKKEARQVEMVKAVRTEEEEAARKEFTGLLNRIAPSNFAHFASRIRDAYDMHDEKVSRAMFTRCITQRIFSDAKLPPLFIDVYSRVLKEVPNAIQPVVDKLKEKADLINVKPFLDALGEETVNFYSTANKTEGVVDEEVKQLSTIARQMNMTTDVRRSIFFAITTALDYQDAYTKVAKLNLTKTQRKDIPLVILECCTKEANYNPYYAQLLEYFIESDKTFKFNFKASLKNSLQLMKKYKTNQIRNVAFLCAELIEKGVFDLFLLKGTKIMSLDAQGMLFMKILFREVFLKLDDSMIIEEVKSVSNSPEFANELRTFLAKRLISFLEKQNSFPHERIGLVKQSAEILNRIQ